MTWEKVPARASTSSSWRARLTMMRVSDEQTCPERKHSAPEIALAAACEVHVVEDHRGRLAAELEGAAGDPLAAERRDAPAGGGRAGERDLVDAGVAHQQLGDLAVGGDDVEHARRQADVLGDLGEEVGVAGRLGRGLEHDGAPGDQRRGDLVGDEADRRVPRDDRADDADRLADQQAELATHGRLRPLLEGIGVGQAGVEVEHAPPSRGRVLGDDVERTGLAWPQLADLVGLAAQALADRPQVFGPLGV